MAGEMLMQSRTEVERMGRGQAAVYSGKAVQDKPEPLFLDNQFTLTTSSAAKKNAASIAALSTESDP
jgi:hypothetical protein